MDRFYDTRVSPCETPAPPPPCKYENVRNLDPQKAAKLGGIRTATEPNGLNAKNVILHWRQKNTFRSNAIALD